MGGSNITGNNATDTSVVSNPAFMAASVQHLVGKYGTAANGGISYYAFDNEPMLWHSTRDVHPQPGTYDNPRPRPGLRCSHQVGQPERQNPRAGENGWCRYLYSAADKLPALARITRRMAAFNMCPGTCSR